jgi:3-carboxy-cis,cis-muconate cycloisomerase
VRPSSSSSSEPAGGLFDAVLARGAVRDEVSDRAWLQAMLDAEAALARALAAAGMIRAEDAETIARTCRADEFDVESIGRRAADAGNPVAPMVAALTAAVGEPASRHVHQGATSQDVLDTAAMLVAARSLRPLLEDLRACATAAAGLVARHRSTPMVARTLLQHALPTTFGLKAAGWMIGLDEAVDRLAWVRAERLAAQLGGAAGTLASLGAGGIHVLSAYAAELGLSEPAIPWHTDRARVIELATALGQAADAIGKPAQDVVLLAQTEVAEVREGAPGRGGSSTLPHKRNPIASVSALACARQAPGLVANVLAAGIQEHERAAGSWHAEWRPLSSLLVSVGSAATWLRDCLEHLEVDERAMQLNLERTGGLLLAERVTGALAPDLGRLAAHEVVERAASRTLAEKRPFAAVLSEAPEIRGRLSAADLERLLDPLGYLGAADALIARALTAHAAREGGASG